MNKVVNVPTDLELASSSRKPGAGAGVLSVQFCSAACAFLLTAHTVEALPSSNILLIDTGCSPTD